MCPVPTFALLALLLVFAQSTSVVVKQHFRNYEKTPSSLGVNGQHGPKRVYSSSAEAHNSPEQSKRTQTEDAPSSGGNKCNIESKSRFDCARDKLLSQSECEDRGCCYALPCWIPVGHLGVSTRVFTLDTKWAPSPPPNGARLPT